jgi:hypothetical protein
MRRGWRRGFPRSGQIERDHGRRNAAIRRVADYHVTVSQISVIADFRFIHHLDHHHLHYRRDTAGVWRHPRPVRSDSDSAPGGIGRHLLNGRAGGGRQHPRSGHTRALETEPRASMMVVGLEITQESEAPLFPPP